MSVIHVHVVCKQFIVSWLVSILSHITFLFNFWMEYLHVASDIAAQSLPVSSLWTLTFLYLYFKSRISCVYYVLWASYTFCLFLFVIIAIKTYNTSPSLRNTFLLYYLLNQSVSSVAMMVNLYSFPRLSTCCSHCFDCTIFETDSIFVWN